MSTEDAPWDADLVTVNLVFDYTVQKVPTRSEGKILTKKDQFYVYLQLLPKNLDERGYPDPRALWFAERKFLEGFEKKHLPDVRLLQWSARVDGDSFVLSEYQVLMARSGD